MFKHRSHIATAMLLIALCVLHASAQSVTCAANRVLAAIESQGFLTRYQYLEPLDDYTVIAGSIGELITYDCTDLSNLTPISSFVFAEPASEIMRTGDYIFRYQRISTTNTLLIYDATNPASPTLISSVPAPGTIDTVIIANDHLICYNQTYYTLYIYDFADPQNPTLVNSTSFKSSISTTALVGNTLYLASASRQLLAFDITNPAVPLHISTFSDFNSSSSYSSLTLGAAGSLVYVNDGCDNLLVVDYTDPFNPVTVWALPIESCPRKITFDGQLAYINYSYAGFDTLDMTNPAAPVRVGHTQTRPYFLLLAPSDNRLFISTTKRELAVIDKQSTIAPSPKQNISNDIGDYRAIAIEGDRLYAAAQYGFMTVSDISDPFNPVILDTEFTTSFATDIAVRNGYAYVACGTGIDVFDLTNPDDPIWITFLSNARAGRIAVDDDTLVAVASEPNGLATFDLADPANPAYIGKYSIGSEYPGKIEIQNNLLFCACGYSTLRVFDIADPSSPSLTDYFIAPGFAEFSQALTVLGNIAYVGSDAGKLYILDVSDPANIILRNSPQLAPDIHALHAVGNRLALDSFGLDLYSIEDPLNPNYIASADSPALFRPIIQGDNLIAAARSAGLWTIDISDCATCPADLNGDGNLDFFDVSAFLVAYNAQNPQADFNSDGLFNFFDVSAFLSSFQQGCP